MNLIGGMKAETESLASMPVTESELSELLASFMNNRNQITQRKAELKQLYQDKKNIFKKLVSAAKRSVKMLPVIFGNDNAALARYGWGAKRKRTPARVPGQPRVLEALTQGTDWLDLDWKPPLDGGKVRFYKILRLVEGETIWQESGVFFKTEGRLKNQPRKVDMQYQVVAVNLAGDSLPSNTVNVVL